MMQSEKAKLIYCFVNDYCIPRTLFKTISKLNIKTVFLNCTETELYKLWCCFFQAAPFKWKKYGTIPCALLSSVSLSVSLSLSLSVCLSVSVSGGVVSFALVCKLHTYALHICHSSILIHTNVHEQTYIESHLPKQVITN
jgi:hypothetical protein